MEEINSHSFKEALEKIDKDIARRPTVAILPKYQEKAFYFFDKSITAKDMNTFVAELQDKLLDSNIAIETSLNEIKGIYEALEKLDDDYIKGILVSLNKANEAATEAKVNTEENTKTIQALKLTVDEFCSLRESVKSQETEFAQLNETLKAKANESKVNEINDLLIKKASQSDVDDILESVKSHESIITQQNGILENKADKSDLSLYAKNNVVFSKEEVVKKINNLWIAYGITTSTLLAGLIASFLI